MFFLLLLGILKTIVFDINASPEFTLMIPLYNEKIKVRYDEYIQCLDINLNNPNISQVHIIYDTSKDKRELLFLELLKQLQTASSKPIVITYIKGRQTFRDFFDVANQLYPNQNIIVSNADIYFDETLSLFENYNLTGQFLGLTRREGDGSIWKHLCDINQPLRSDSQDSWIFRTPINIANAGFQLGTIACDPYIAFAAEQSGYKVRNPCMSIKAHHVHGSLVRHYNARAGYDVKKCKILRLENL